MSVIYINNTGIREGERILGIGKQCKGSIIQVMEGFYPPCKIFIDNTLLIRDRFPLYEFYSNMTHENILEYIMSSGIDNKDLYMEDVHNLVVKFEILSGEFFSKYPDICNALISYGPINIRDAYNMFPKNPGSKARKHTLVFRPSNWTLIESGKKEYNTCIDVMAGTVCSGKNNVYVVDEVGYYIKPGNTLITGRHKMKEMSWYPPSLLKSVIQKIIRVKPINVIFPGEVKYPALHVLHSAITCLLEHPGSFVPNIQKFVKGSESCFKRLAVSIVEDSYITNSHNIYILLVNALLLQRDPSYIPNHESIGLLYSCSEEALASPYAYVGNINKNVARGVIYSCDLSWFPISSNVLSSIGSFESDIRMFNEYVGCSTYQYIEHDMNIWHAIDHHCYTDIAWFCNMDSYLDYGSLFNDIWQLSSKYNPRRGHTTTLPFNEPQRECYLFHMPKDEIVTNNGTGYIIRISYVLHEDFIHSLIGTIYYGNYIITKLGVGIARKPKRDNPSYAKIPITLDEKNIIYTYVYEELRKGIKRTMPGYSDILITCNEEDKAIIIWNGVKYLWNDLRRITLDLKEGVDIMPNYKELVEEIKTLDPSIKKRLFMYCSTWRDKIEIHRIGRDGKGTKYAVNRLDSYVFQILMKMCKIFPGCIRMVEGNIKITNNVMFWYIRDKLLFRDNTIRTYNGFTYDTNIEDERVLYPYQRDCVDRLIANKTHGSILWIDVGMGKTLIVLTYLKYLIDNGQMTSYCCYTLPPSALDSIAREIELSGIQYNILDMRKNGKNNILLPNCINILYHDHLRLGNISEQLRLVSDDLIFIVDEFHLCLSSSTIRTSLTLEIAKLSHRFVAMSGTILNSIDAIDDMIEWLELTVPYPLHKNNYQVAISDLISFDTNLGSIKLIKKDIEVTMTPNELIEYGQYVPKSIGGTSNRLQLYEALKSCYNTILPRMAEYAKKYVISNTKPLFIVVHNKEQQDRMEEYLTGYSIFKIGIDKAITLKKDDETRIQFIITTMNYNAGYTLTKCNTMITSVYPSNEASRTQIEGRLYRLGQTEDVNVVTFHTGILSYMLEKYKKTGNMNKVLKELSSM